VRTLDCMSVLYHVHILQTSTFIFAGMDTTSNSMSRVFSLLASHPEIQEKVRQEILDGLENNGGRAFSYDKLVSLPLLDAVCRETLRLWVREPCPVICSDHITNTQQLSSCPDRIANVRRHYGSPALTLN
jgi:Cytochrome P450